MNELNPWQSPEEEWAALEDGSWRDRVDGQNWMIKPDHTVYPLSMNQMMEWLRDHGVEEWQERKRVTLDTVDGVDISTVFLYHNHSFLPTEPPILYETMVFGGPLDQAQQRYSTWDEAIEGHEAMLAQVKLALAVQAQVEELL